MPYTLPRLPFLVPTLPDPGLALPNDGVVFRTVKRVQWEGRMPTDVDIL